MKFNFRKWLFNLITGYDFVEYEDILREWNKTLQLAQKINDKAERVNNNCQQLIDNSHEVISIAKKIIKENNK